jgi:hypothetical protein
MLSREDNPNIPNFNFGTDSVFNSLQEYPANSLPPIGNAFLLLDNTPFLLLDGTNLLLL